MIEKELLKRILAEQRENLLRKPSGIKRDALAVVLSKKRLPHVVVLTGLRRSGKSTMLKQISEELYSKNDFYYLSFEDERLAGITAAEFNYLYETIVEMFGPFKTFLIDEIQNVPQFENFVRRFYDNGFKFYITGSNARLLSREIGTKLTGRHIDIEVKPFNFREYLKAKGEEINETSLLLTEHRAKLIKMFNKFLTGGGIPEYVLYEENELLLNIYNDIVYKDIFARYSIDDIKRTKSLYANLISNVGQKFSYNSLKNSLDYGSGNTVRTHIHYLEETYLIRVAEQFQYSTKKQVRSDKKIYVIDNGIQRLVSTKYMEDRGWMLENLTVNSISSLDNLYYFFGSGECDIIYFINNKEPMPIQITWELTPGNREREIAGLIEAMRYLRVKKGYILTHWQDDEFTIEGKKIVVISALKWFLSQSMRELI